MAVHARLPVDDETARAFRASTRPRLYEAPVAAGSRRGDVVLLGAGGSLDAIGRLCNDPETGDDGEAWAWVQCQPLAAPVAEPAAVGGDALAGPRLDLWERGEGRYPRRIGLDALRQAPGPDEPEADAGLRLLVRERLVERLGVARDPEPGELGVRDLDALLLVSRVHPRPTLVLIDATIHAVPQLGREPVDRLLALRAAVREDVGRAWRVVPWAIARELHPEVVAHARRERITCSRASEQGARIELQTGPAVLPTTRRR